ncbi:S8 family peptidase [Aquirufa aurantiipilula]|uniref:S8 family peptidase n=1 Tax=Aquirufa aurantiipilula TaxID=2696561 RepID=UPI001CAA7EA1|nr:S8 family peptidase [Aquirufa aurantiipilula]MBZ1327005.1 S8 family peptidase [Aquirufa aurantiipilula]
MNNKRRPILYKGELYSHSITKRSSNFGKPLPISFNEAKDKIINDLDSATEILRQLPINSRLPNEIVLCMRMHPDFSAKSYYPDSIFDGTTERFGLQEIGSRIWRSEHYTEKNEKNDLTQGKLFFVRGTEVSINKFKTQLNKPEDTQTKSFTEDVRKLMSIDLLSEKEQIGGFQDDWKSGRLEAVLHPFDIDKKAAMDQFLNLIKSVGVDLDQVRYKQYDEGITFISLMGNRDVLNILAGFNPLRTIHPLNIRDLSKINRGYLQNGAPTPPVFTIKPLVTVGVIDGGYTAGNPALDPYVDYEECVSGNEVDYLCDHGTQVASAVLYGALNKYKNSDQLPEPSVSVKVFRVLSVDSKDADLYDVIDAIEKIVPSNDHIKVYNLSLGPEGQILDDHISRFTFACDILIQKHNILFCTAVGNDGEIIGYNRIQAPSDMINGLAIGAYSKFDDTIFRAPYSCIGPGREGNKLKPDLSAFGGCDQNPIQLMNNIGGSRVLTQGTSFSSPIASATTSQLMGYSDNVINALIARALIIHGVSEKCVGYTNEIGHGILLDDIQQFATCPEKSYTLIYNGEIESGKYIELPIPWSEDILTGNIIFRWTAAVLTNVDPQSPDDYSTSSIVTSFYPNSSKFAFKKGNKIKQVDISVDPAKVQQLEAEGWAKLSTFPVSESGKTPFQTENDLRSDFKWDSLESKRKNKRAENIKKPMFHIHALQRGRRKNSKKVKYALILTVISPKSSVDLYSKIINQYNALVPVKLEITARASASASA